MCSYPRAILILYLSLCYPPFEHREGWGGLFGGVSKVGQPATVILKEPKSWAAPPAGGALARVKKASILLRKECTRACTSHFCELHSS
jgi:hypothetical protein